MIASRTPNGYVDAPTLLVQIFPNKGLSLRTLRKLQAEGRIPFLKIGKRVLFQPSEVLAALEKQFKRVAA